MNVNDDECVGPYGNDDGGTYGDECGGGLQLGLRTS